MKFHANCLETVCRKYRNLFPGTNKKKYVNLSSAEFAQRVIKVKLSGDG